MYNVKRILRHVRDVEIYNAQMVQKRRRNDKNLREYNFTQNTISNLYKVNEKMYVHIQLFNFNEKERNDGRYTDHLSAAQFSSCGVNVPLECQPLV